MIRGIPLALLALTLGAFAIGTTEFVIVGLIPTIAADLQVSLPSAGLLVSLYALGVAIGAPVLTALTGRMPRKTLLVALMVLFTLGNVIAFLAPGYTSLIAARILTGLAHGVFFSIGSIIATAVVPKEKAAGAIAIMFTGLTVALVTGVPLGTFIGQHLGWRATFLAVAGLGVIALLGALLFVPRSVPQSAPSSFRQQLAVLAQPRLLLVYAMTTLGYGGASPTWRRSCRTSPVSRPMRSAWCCWCTACQWRSATCGAGAWPTAWARCPRSSVSSRCWPSCCSRSPSPPGTPG